MIDVREAISKCSIRCYAKDKLPKVIIGGGPGDGGGSKHKKGPNLS